MIIMHLYLVCIRRKNSQLQHNSILFFKIQISFQHLDVDMIYMYVINVTNLVEVIPIILIVINH